jgi:hypothetical protein
MKTKVIFLAIVTLLLSGGVAHAQVVGSPLEVNTNAEVNSTGTVEIGRYRGNSVDADVEMRAETRARLEARQAEMEERRAEMEERRSQIQVMLSERVQVRIENFANGLFRALDAGVLRLENIAERIDSRIEKLEDDGMDMSAQAELLLNAEVEIDEAETEIAEARVELEAMLSSDTPREALENVRTALSEAKQALREARQALIETVQSIKRAMGEQEVNAEAEAEVGAENQ